MLYHSVIKKWFQNIVEEKRQNAEYSVHYSYNYTNTYAFGKEYDTIFQNKNIWPKAVRLWGIPTHISFNVSSPFNTNNLLLMTSTCKALFQVFSILTMKITLQVSAWIAQIFITVNWLF